MRAVFAMCVLVPMTFGQGSTRMMTKLTAHLESPAIREGSFAAKPKTMYRAGDSYCRIEELPDPEHSIHRLMIINEPNLWMVNLFGKTARHYVDSCPTFNCHLPIFHGEQVNAPADIKRALLELEFGQEIVYFKSKGGIPKQGPVLRDKPTSVYTSESGDSQLSLFTTGMPERPWALARQQGSSREIFWYGTYEQLPFDPKLFAKPSEMKMEEAK